MSNEYKPSDDDIYTPIGIQFDRVKHLKLTFEQIALNGFDSISLKYLFDGGFVFSLFDEMLHFK